MEVTFLLPVKIKIFFFLILFKMGKVGYDVYGAP